MDVPCGGELHGGVDPLIDRLKLIKSESQTVNPDCDRKIRIMIMWGDHSIESGHSATDVLEQVCGGWNPPTVPDLRRVLAKRCGLAMPTERETDLEFLRRLADAKVILLYELDESEWA